jgi:ankyrin repeat protein
MITELFKAIEDHDLDRLAALLGQGVDPNATKPERHQCPPLHTAIEEIEEGGSIEAVVLLVRHGASVDGLDGARDLTPLLIALFSNQKEAVRILLAAGADPNIEGGEGDSPLRWCVGQGDHGLAATLLRCGATKTIDASGGPSGMTALGLAVSRLDLAMMELLLRFKADAEVHDADHRVARDHLPPPSSVNEEARTAAEVLLNRARKL